MNEIRRPQEDGPRAPVRISMPEVLLRQAADLGVDISKAAEDGVRQAIDREMSKAAEERAA
jgi:post-segregation antitoxin (ccd killing protein)